MNKLLWKPSEERVKESNMLYFMNFVNNKYKKNFTEYRQVYDWSVNSMEEFWSAVWKFMDIKASVPYDRVIDDPEKMPGAKWFEGARLNFAENLLRHRDGRCALIFNGETQKVRMYSYGALYNEVAKVALSLKEMGVVPGDRVAGFMPNMIESVVAMLATTSLGAIWSSCSPDFGVKGVMDRFGQIEPKVLFTADAYFFKGKQIDSLETASTIAKNIASIEKVVIVSYVRDQQCLCCIPKAVRYNDFKSSENDLVIDFAQLPFSHPLYIMYSSGTTGLPKCLVQSAGGILMNHLKELVLHTDLSRSDTIFYFTTCGWMMWNWLVSSLAVGATVVLYDGNPFYPDAGVLWRMAQDEDVTVFGTSAGYINALQQSGVCPGKEYDLSNLRTVLSTGSPLSTEGFEFVYQNIKQDLQLASICGGTDINGCFFLGNPMAPVYAGELQCRGLGMKVEAFDEKGSSVVNKQGELVCTAPFPSMPIYFWDDPDGQKYHKAYFDVYPNIWRHGDFVEISERCGAVIYGRSDATLNPGGVRMGTAEIYRQIEQLEEIEDSVVIGQNWQNDVRVILFVVMKQGIELTEEVKTNIKMTIRKNLSPRHMPAKIIAVPEVPYTLNMKKVEIAVRNTIHGKPVLNKDSLRNSSVLDYFENLSELNED